MKRSAKESSKLSKKARTTTSSSSQPSRSRDPHQYSSSDESTQEGFRSTAEESEEAQETPSFVTCSAVLGKAIVTRLVDVRFGTPFEGNRPLVQPHVDLFVEKFKDIGPNYRQHIITISVHTKEDLQKALNPSCFDFNFTIEVS